jgi:hypothetical protein
MSWEVIALPITLPLVRTIIALETQHLARMQLAVSKIVLPADESETADAVVV